MNTDQLLPVRAIITGVTGMVGEGVLHECLQHPGVEQVLMINRRPAGIVHPKLKEIIHADLYDLSPIAGQLQGYNTCLFCLGVSSIGMKEEPYYKLTYTLTLQVAEVLRAQNADMTFCYISGAGTDSTERGRSMWARVKGKTENDLQKLGFRAEFNFRPGFIKPTKGLANTHSFYRYINWFFPIGRSLYPGGFCTMRELGLAMIRVAARGYERTIVKGKDIIALAKAERLIRS